MLRFVQYAVLALALTPAAPGRAAEIYKCLDGSGRALYTSEKRDTVGKKCEVVSREVNVAPSLVTPKPGAKTAPPAYPREDFAARAAAKERQRQILERELAAEQTLLDKARKTLAEQESVRQGDERNYARVIERLKPYQDDVEVHEKNVAALKRELDSLYK